MNVSTDTNQNHHHSRLTIDKLAQYDAMGRNLSRMEGKSGAANKEAMAEHECRIFMNTNEVVFNYVCKCNACASTTTTGIRRSSIGVANDSETALTPVIVFRPNLVNEIMRKFSSALINISHYLRSEKAQLSPTEVSAVSAKLGKLLIQSRSEKPQRGKNTERLNSREIPVQTKPDPLLRIKETNTSKKRRMMNALKRQRIEEKERERLVPEWNSTPCLASSRKKSASDTQGLQNHSLRVEFKRDIQESKSLGPIVSPRGSSGDSLSPTPTREYFEPVNILPNRNAECRVTKPLRPSPINGQIKETAASRKRRALNMMNKQRLDEEERKRNEAPHWNSSTRFSNLRKTGPQYSTYPMLSKAQKFARRGEIFEKTLHPIYSDDLYAMQCQEHLDENYLVHHVYHTAQAAGMRTKQMRNRRRFFKRRGAKFLPKCVLNNFTDSTESSTSPGSGYQTWSKTFPYRPSVWENPTCSEETNAHEFLWNLTGTDTSEPESSERNHKSGVEEECKDVVEKKPSSDSLPKRLSKMSLTELPEKLFPETCRLLNNRSSTSATQKSSHSRTSKGSDSRLKSEQSSESKIENLGNNDSDECGRDLNSPCPKESRDLSTQTLEPGKDSGTRKRPKVKKPKSSARPKKDAKEVSSVYHKPGSLSDEDWWSTSSRSGYETSMDVEIVSD